MDKNGVKTELGITGRRVNGPISLQLDEDIRAEIDTLTNTLNVSRTRLINQMLRYVLKNVELVSGSNE